MTDQMKPLLLSDGAVGFRRPEACDVPHYLRLRNNLSLASKLMAHRMGVGQEGIRDWITRAATSIDEVFFTAVLVEEGQRPVGFAKIFRIDAFSRTAWIGLSLFDERDAGSGRGSAMLVLLCEYLRSHLACRKVSLEVTADNLAAVRTYLKHGFQEEGRMKAQFFANGKYQDVLILSRVLGDE